VKHRPKYHAKTKKLLSDASKGSALELNAEKTKYIVIHLYQTTEQNSFFKEVNKSFENVAKFRYLGMPVIN
jgi:23S rRNA U2552 (ribose-2'-O)-methylase RlmE/FtsJ